MVKSQSSTTKEMNKKQNNNVPTTIVATLRVLSDKQCQNIQTQIQSHSRTNLI